MLSKMFQVEVVYANPSRQSLIALQVTADCTVESAIQQSGILQDFPEIDFKINKVGIFSKIIPLNSFLREGDRIEIYRPLLVDPKQLRKQRAKKNSWRK